jgi:hypothetical protein
VRERRFTQAGRAIEKEMVEGLVAFQGSLDGNAEVVLQLFLTDKLSQAPGSKGPIEVILFLDVPGNNSLFSSRGDPP